MVRPKGTSKNDSNHKLTDFFSSMSSSQQFRSSQPTPSSSLSSSFAKGKRPVRISDKDGNLASLYSKFSELDREYVEKVYLECNRDYGRANATLHRGRRASLTPKCQSATSAAASVDEPFEKLKTLMPKLSREKFDEAYRACGGDAKKTAKMLLPPEYNEDRDRCEVALYLGNAMPSDLDTSPFERSLGGAGWGLASARTLGFRCQVT